MLIPYLQNKIAAQWSIGQYYYAFFLPAKKARTA